MTYDIIKRNDLNLDFTIDDAIALKRVAEIFRTFAEADYGGDGEWDDTNLNITPEITKSFNTMDDINVIISYCDELSTSFKCLFGY